MFGKNDSFYIVKPEETSTQEVEKRIILPHEFGMLIDIMLLTPFALPFKKPKVNAPLLNSVKNFMSDDPKESDEIHVPFYRVDKVPYYLEEQ